MSKPVPWRKILETYSELCMRKAKALTKQDSLRFKQEIAGLWGMVHGAADLLRICNQFEAGTEGDGELARKVREG